MRLAELSSAQHAQRQAVIQTLSAAGWTGRPLNDLLEFQDRISLGPAGREMAALLQVGPSRISIYSEDEGLVPVSPDLLASLEPRSPTWDMELRPLFWRLSRRKSMLVATAFVSA
ncbi:MAG: hypothetical protein JXA21_25695 [Anaerolineae bacterium]|nr:hypothetical protein [Anaerolineae bacterium]